jgi:hypothetical protein
MKKLTMIVLMAMVCILLNGQVKKKVIYIDDLYATSRDSLVHKNINHAELIIDQLNLYKEEAVKTKNTGIVSTSRCHSFHNRLHSLSYLLG